MTLTTEYGGVSYLITANYGNYTFAESYPDYCDWRMSRAFSYLSGLLQFVRDHCPESVYTLLRKELNLPTIPHRKKER